MNRWQEIFDLLTEAGIETYAPGGHIGLCSSPYCVVQAGSGSIPNGTRMLGKCDYRIYLVVPIEEPARLAQLAEQVRQALRPMESSGVLRLDMPRSAMVPDDSFSALVSYIDYTCCYSERN